jgi:hypothetical protein
MMEPQTLGCPQTSKAHVRPKVSLLCPITPMELTGPGLPALVYWYRTVTYESPSFWAYTYWLPVPKSGSENVIRTPDGGGGAASVTGFDDAQPPSAAAQATARIAAIFILVPCQRRSCAAGKRT